MTATAEMRSFSLSDGSSVHLGPDSAIAVDFDGEARRVRLVQGEAFFEVAPDPESPFRVAAGEVITTVLGTAFNVRLGDRAAGVAVRHGRVGVKPSTDGPQAAQRLESGDWLRVASPGRVSRGSLPPDEVGSWRQGQIVARDRAIADVMEDLRRYHSGIIVLTDRALGEQRVSGVYNVADPLTALAAMAGAHSGVVRQISPWVLVVSAR